MHSGFFFSIIRVLEILTLIPVWGLLAWFVDRWQPSTPPDAILFLFIVAILATVWSIATLLMYRRMQWTPLYIAIMDLIFFGLLIGGVVLLAPLVRWTDCINWSGYGWWFMGSSGGWRSGDVAADKQCMMLKSAWGLGILDVILFFATAVLAWHVWHSSGLVVHETRPRRRSRKNRY